MGFIVVEEWVDARNPYKYYWVQVSAQTFATKEEAEEEKKRHQAKHTDGHIRIRHEEKESATKKRKGRKKASKSSGK